MTMPTPGGNRSISASFDVLVLSVDALNTSIRSLSNDVRRNSDALALFNPGGGGGGGGGANNGNLGANGYNPTAGQTQGPGMGGGPGVPFGNPQAGQTQQGPAQAPGGGTAPHGGQGGGGHGQQGGGGGGWTNMALNAGYRVPYLGTAMRAAGAIGDLYQSEREKNRAYQGIEGGSNASGFGERMHEEAYRWSMGFAMSGEMARRSFKGVTALGYTGKDQSSNQGRQAGLDFVYHNYNSRGMDVDESLGFLQSASRDATVNFSALSKALKEVSDTAGQAGVNAKLMRENFQGMLDTSISTGAGPGAANIAGMFSSTQASYGRSFQNSDMTGQLSTSYQYMVGAQYGVRPGQLQSIMRNKPQEYGRMVSGSQRQVITTTLGQSAITDLEALIKQYGSTQQAVPVIEQEFLNKHTEIDLNNISRVLSGALTGVQLDNSNVMDWIIQQLMGNTAAAHTDTQNAMAPVSSKDTKGAPTGKFGLVESTSAKTDAKSAASSVEYNIKHAGDYKDWGGLHNKESKTGKTYYDIMEKSGKRDPVLEALLQNVKDPDATNVKVATASGDRVVSLAEAMKLFPNELARGDVELVSGNQSGQSVSDIVGGNVDASRDVKGELTNPDGSKIGQSLKQYEAHDYKDYPGKGGKQVSDNLVKVDLTAEAKQLLQLLPSINNQSSATGYPPYNPNATQGSRP